MPVTNLVGSAADVPMSVMECCNCGVSFGVTVEFERRRRGDHEGFYCPSGHKQHFSGQTPLEQERDRLKAERDRLAGDLRWKETTIRSLNIRNGKTAAKARRLEARVACGCCPHCNRTFKQLAAHIKTKHPAQAPKVSARRLP